MGMRAQKRAPRGVKPSRSVVGDVRSLKKTRSTREVGRLLGIDPRSVDALAEGKNVLRGTLHLVIGNLAILFERRLLERRAPVERPRGTTQ